MRVSALTPPLSGCDPWKDHKPANRLHRDSQEVAVTGCLSFLEMSAVAPGPFTGPLDSSRMRSAVWFPSQFGLPYHYGLQSFDPPFILLHLPQAWRRPPMINSLIPHPTWCWVPSDPLFARVLSLGWGASILQWEQLWQTAVEKQGEVGLATLTVLETRGKIIHCLTLYWFTEKIQLWHYIISQQLLVN